MLLVSTIIPLFMSLVVLERFFDNDDTITGKMIYQSGNLQGIFTLREKVREYIENHEPLPNDFIDEIGENNLYNDKYAGIIVFKNNKIIFSSEYFNHDSYKKIRSDLIKDNQFMGLVGSILYIQERILFEDGLEGKLFLGIDTLESEKQSDRYWVAQLTGMLGVNVFLVMLLLAFMTRNVNKAIKSMGDITQKLQKVN